jgi:creatinine amidohydrolase
LERQLQKLNWLTVRDLVPDKIDIAILPVGTVEAHGSACLGTDNFIPQTIAEGIAPRLSALIAPTVSYGVSKSLYRYNGCCTIGPSTFKMFIRDILDSLAETGFRNILVLNGHGGNNSALKEAAYAFHREMKRNVAVIHWWELCGEMTREFFGHVGGHGGVDETAMVQAVDENLADKDAYDPEMAYYFHPGADVYPVPGTILLYKKGEGYPNFDVKQAREYHEHVVAKVGDFAEDVIARWRRWGV